MGLSLDQTAIASSSSSSPASQELQHLRAPLPTRIPEQEPVTATAVAAPETVPGRGFADLVQSNRETLDFITEEGRFSFWC